MGPKSSILFWFNKDTKFCNIPSAQLYLPTNKRSEIYVVQRKQEPNYVGCTALSLSRW